MLEFQINENLNTIVNLAFYSGTMLVSLAYLGFIFKYSDKILLPIKKSPLTKDPKSYFLKKI